MTVSKEVRRVWKREKEHGDVKNICETTGLAPKTVYRAMRKGKCSTKTFELISSYFIAKRERESLLAQETVERLTKQN